MDNNLMKMKGINIKMVEMLAKLKKRQDELSNSYLVIKNKVADLEKELQQNREQLQKITGAIMEFDRLIQLCEAESKENEIKN